MKRQAQFFLIAGLIIAGVILGLSYVYSTAQIEKQELFVYDLSDEIYYEASQVIDNGIVTGLSEEQTADNLENLTKHYSSLHPDSDIVILYGDESSLHEISQISDPSLQDPVKLDIKELEGRANRLRVEIKQPGNSGKKFESEPVIREFDLIQGQNFYLVLRKKVRNEQFVVSR